MREGVGVSASVVLDNKIIWGLAWGSPDKLLRPTEYAFCMIIVGISSCYATVAPNVKLGSL